MLARKIAPLAVVINHWVAEEALIQIGIDVRDL